MEVLNTFLIVMGFCFTGWYIKILRSELKSQKNLVESQSKILTDAKTLLEIYDAKKLKEFVEIREQTISLQKDKQIDEIMNDIKKRKEAEKLITNEFFTLIHLSAKLIGSTPPFFTREIINKMPDDSLSKEPLMKLSDQIVEIYSKTYGTKDCSFISELEKARFMALANALSYIENEPPKHIL